MLSTHSATQNAAIAPPSAYIPCYSRQLAHHAHPRIPRRLVRIINGGCTPQRGGGRDALLPFSLLVLSSKSGVRCDKPQAFLFVLHFMNGFAINNRSPLPLSLPPSPSLLSPSLSSLSPASHWLWDRLGPARPTWPPRSYAYYCETTRMSACC